MRWMWRKTPRPLTQCFQSRCGHLPSDHWMNARKFVCISMPRRITIVQIITSTMHLTYSHEIQGAVRKSSEFHQVHLRIRSGELLLSVSESPALLIGAGSMDWLLPGIIRSTYTLKCRWLVCNTTSSGFAPTISYKWTLFAHCALKTCNYKKAIANLC